ncbi:hypothetical protein [Candidatus Pelagibacter sp.]|uniref:hypothetical protein n=1 Tax=Candidatus Pelagibacter sp. TaxID=2024849 RepID=UPI003F87EF74
MRYTLIILSIFLFNKISFAENSLDYLSSVKGSLDTHYECNNKNNNVFQFGFKKINNNLMVYRWEEAEEVYGPSISAVKTFKSKFQGQEFQIFLFFEPNSPTLPTGSSISLQVLAKSKEMKNSIYIDYWVDNSENDKSAGNSVKNHIYDDWENLFKVSNVDDIIETHDEDLIKWSDNVYKLLSKKLDFGDPLEMVDLQVAPWEKVLVKHKGRFVRFEYSCKES